MGTVTVQRSGSDMQVVIKGQTVKLIPAWRDTYMFPYAPWGGHELALNFWRVGGKVKYIVSRAGVGART